MMDASKGKTRSLFSILDLIDGFSTATGSLSFFLFLLAGRSFNVSSVLSVFATWFSVMTLPELVSPALIVKVRERTKKKI